MKKLFTDRSRIETFQRCPRRRFLEYSQDSTGIVPARKNLALAVGGSVHVGLATLLRGGSSQWALDGFLSAPNVLEDIAVKDALLDFASVAGLGLELDATEQAAMTPTEDAERQRAEMLAQAKELGMSAEGLGVDRMQAVGEFERMLYAEQSALVEALVRAYARRRLRPLLDQFEVMEVEREGEWTLGDYRSHAGLVGHPDDGSECDEYCGHWQLWFMSRPDALLRERSSNELYLLSFKTTAGWDVRKAKSAEVDMQGLSEGVEVERRLGEWWKQIQDIEKHINSTHRLEGLGKEVVDPSKVGEKMFNYLEGLSAPPRIHAIRYEYLLKGERWEDKDLSLRLGMTVRTQRSHLIRHYCAVSVPKKGDGGYQIGDSCWSWDYKRVEDDKGSKLSWQNWKSQAVWETYGSVKRWIDLLDSSELLMSGEDSTVGLEPRALGYRSLAQALGVTAEHPLDAVFLPPIVVYRSDDQLRDWIEQVEAQERRVAEAVAEVEGAQDTGERHSLLNRHFPQARHSCFYPSQCQFSGVVCFAANSEAEANPMSTGKFVARKANHPQENISVENAEYS